MVMTITPGGNESERTGDLLKEEQLSVQHEEKHRLQEKRIAAIREQLSTTTKDIAMKEFMALKRMHRELSPQLLGSPLKELYGKTFVRALDALIKRCQDKDLNSDAIFTRKNYADLIAPIAVLRDMENTAWLSSSTLDTAQVLNDVIDAVIHNPCFSKQKDYILNDIYHKKKEAVLQSYLDSYISIYRDNPPFTSLITTAKALVQRLDNMLCSYADQWENEPTLRLYTEGITRSLEYILPMRKAFFTGENVLQWLKDFYIESPDIPLWIEHSNMKWKESVRQALQIIKFFNNVALLVKKNFAGHSVSVCNDEAFFSNDIFKGCRVVLTQALDKAEDKSVYMRALQEALPYYAFRRWMQKSEIETYQAYSSERILPFWNDNIVRVEELYPNFHPVSHSPLSFQEKLLVAYCEMTVALIWYDSEKRSLAATKLHNLLWVLKNSNNGTSLLAEDIMSEKKFFDVSALMNSAVVEYAETICDQKYMAENMLYDRYSRAVVKRSDYLKGGYALAHWRHNDNVPQTSNLAYFLSSPSLLSTWHQYAMQVNKQTVDDGGGDTTI